MKMNKFTILVLSFLLVTVFIAGCAKKDTTVVSTKPADTMTPTTSAVVTPEPAVNDKEIVVGVTVQDMSNEFIAMLKDAMQLKAKEYPNLKLIINDAEAKPDKQASQMDAFISQKVGAIIINPADANALTPSIENAIKAGIPVITLSSDAAKNVGQKWSGSKNEDAGRMEMEFIAKKLGGKGNIAIIRGPIGHFAEIGRFAGYKEVLDKNPGMKIVTDQTGNWSREEAMSLMENWIQAGKKIDAVVAQNDAMALGALKAVEDSGNKGKILVVGIDAIKDALDSVKTGGMDATFFQDAIGQANGAVDMAVKGANGQAFEENIIPFEEVTKANADSFYSRISLKK
ncbi:MAG: rhizopine-binding protein [Bacilli bacterium]|nr:rhizopine-binding protein [Bacilli bacterium]